jgi:Rod binding domain-containing protein
MKSPSVIQPQSNVTEHKKIDDSRVTPEMRQAAEALESQFVSMMMDAMRKNEGEPSEFSLHNSASDIYQGMLDQHYADISAKSNSLGLSQQIIDYWLRSQPDPKYNGDRSIGTGGTDED